MLTFRAWVLLWTYDLFLLVHFIKPLRGWQYRALRATVKGWKVRSCEVDEKDIARVCYAVELACVLYFKHVLCLQKAVVKAYLLRKRGHAAAVVLGGHKNPFYKEHSWIEINGRVVDEKRDVRKLFQVWETY